MRQPPLQKLARVGPPGDDDGGFRTSAEKAAAEAASPLEPPSGPVAEQRAFESRPENRLTVPEVLARPDRCAVRRATWAASGPVDDHNFARVLNC